MKPSDSPAALQLRYLQTLNSIAAEKNSTIVFPVPMELFRGFTRGFDNNKHNHDHTQGYHHHHHMSIGANNGTTSHLHHSDSVEQNLALSSKNPNTVGLQLSSNLNSGIRKKSGSLIMDMSIQNPVYTPEINAEMRQDSIEKQIDGLHVDFGLDEMTSV